MVREGVSHCPGLHWNSELRSVADSDVPTTDKPFSRDEVVFKPPVYTVDYFIESSDLQNKSRA